MPWGTDALSAQRAESFVTFCCYHRRRLLITGEGRRIFDSALERVPRSFRLGLVCAIPLSIRRYIIRTMGFNVDAFLDGFTGAGLFGRLRPPSAPNRLFAEGATVDEMPLAVRARMVADVLLAQ